MIKIDRFYRSVGIRTKQGLLTPEFFDFTINNLPQFSCVHMLTDMNYPAKSLPIFTLVPEVIVSNVMDYHKPIGKFSPVRINEISMVKELNKLNSSVETFTKYRVDRLFKNTNKLKETVIVYTGSNIHKQYKYPRDLLLRYTMYVNKVNGMLKNMIDVSNIDKKMNHFLVIDLPDIFYSFNYLNKICESDMTTTILNKFINDEMITLMELFKLFSDSKKKSVFYSLIENPSVFSETYLIFRYKNVNSVINLYTLLSLSDSYNVGELSSKMKDKTIRVALYNMFSNIVNKHNINISKEDIVSLLHENTDEETIDVLKSMVHTDEEVSVTDEDVEESITHIPTVDNTTYLDPKLSEGHVPVINKVDSYIENLKDNGEIDKPKYKRLTGTVKDLLNKKSPLDKDKTIREVLDETNVNFDLDRDKANFPVDLHIKTEEEDLSDPLTYITKEMVNKQMPKDIIKTFVNLQQTGLIVKDIEVNNTESILGDTVEYAITFSDKGKSTFTKKILLPEIKPNGTYTMSGNTYRLKLQRIDLPIKKISSTIVNLNSGTGKLKVITAPVLKYNVGYKLKKQLGKMEDNGEVSSLIFGSNNLMDIKVPNEYYLFARFIKSFKYLGGKYSFNYNDRESLLPSNIKLKDIEKDGSILIGMKGKYPIIMKSDSTIVIDKVDKDSLSTTIGIDLLTKIEYTFLSIFATDVPVGILLTYYMGITNLLKELKCEYEVFDGGKRINDNRLVLKFEDKTIAITIDNSIQAKILYGLNHDVKILKEFQYSVLDNKTLFKTIFSKLGYNLVTVSTIDLTELNFIDAVTENVLRGMKEPTTFIGLLIRATELLTTDEYYNPLNVSTSRLRGYERIPQFIHKVMMDSIKKKKSEEFFGKSKLVLDPYSVWRMLNDDSSSELVDDTNPISYLKQQEEFTFTGQGGMSKETMVIGKRGYNKDDIGVVSEGVKDSTDVGISAYISASPMLTTIYGTSKGNNTDLKYSNIMATNTMLSPFLLMDDPKRVIYSAIQAGGVIPVKNPRVFPVRTPYGSIIAYKLGSNFVGFTTKEGVVTEVNENLVIVKYKDKEVVEFPCNNWTSKEDSGTTYNHELRVNVKKGDKVKPGDIMYYDYGFFGVDMFDSTRVVYRPGTYALVAMVSKEGTREDSFYINKKISEELANSVTKVKSEILKNTDILRNITDIDIDVNHDSVLFNVVSELVGDEKLSKETMDLMQGFVRATVKSDYVGKLFKVKVYYNCELSELSSSIKKLVTMSKPFMVNGSSPKVYSGKVNSSYSVNGKPLAYGDVHIKFYMDVKETMGTGDKGVLSNQLKGTINTVSDIVKTDILGNEIEMEVDYTGVWNRIVPSSDMAGTTGMVLKIGQDLIVNKFFS